MGWNKILEEHTYHTSDGDFTIIKGEFNGVERYGVKWSTYPREPVVIPPKFSKMIRDAIENDDEDSISNIVDSVQ